MFDLKGRTVVITGASSGLGKAAVYAYAKAGAAVLITARRFERLEAIREELAAQDYRVEAVACDVREEEQVRETVKHALRSFGKIDVLCSFAAVTDDRDVAELESGQWNDVLQTNLSGVYYFSKHVIPHMKECGYGRIINIGSVNGLVGSKMKPRHGYNASKGGLHGLTIGMAATYMKYGITVNAIAPGLFRTEMTEAVFVAEPSRLLIAAAVGIVLLLLLIIKFKIHPVLSLLISALFIGLGAGMPVPTLVSTVEKGAGETLQGIVLLIGLGSLFGGILEVSGGAQCVAQTLVNKFSEKKAGIALGITGLVVGTTVFFEAGVVILIPLAFGLAKKTKKSTLCYVIPLLAGLATGFAFIPPSAGSVLVANMLNVDLGVMIAVGIPVGILSLLFAGILWSNFIGSRISTGLPSNIQEVRVEEEANLPAFSTVLCIILVPLVLILLSTISTYVPGIDAVRPVLEFLGTPFVALIIAVLFAMYFLGKRQGYDGEQLKKIMDRSLRPTGQILLVITGGGIIRWILQDCGMGDIIGPALEKSGLPLILVAFLIAALIRASVGAAVVAMTMAAGIMAAMPGVAGLSPVYLAAMVCAINGGATAFSHVNDSGFWLVSSLLEIDEKTTLKSWTMMETIIGLTGLICAIVISLFA